MDPLFLLPFLLLEYDFDFRFTILFLRCVLTKILVIHTIPLIFYYMFCQISGFNRLLAAGRRGLHPHRILITSFYPGATDYMDRTTTKTWRNGVSSIR